MVDDTCGTEIQSLCGSSLYYKAGLLGCLEYLAKQETIISRMTRSCEHPRAPEILHEGMCAGYHHYHHYHHAGLLIAHICQHYVGVL